MKYNEERRMKLLMLGDIDQNIFYFRGAYFKNID